MRNLFIKLRNLFTLILCLSVLSCTNEEEKSLKNYKLTFLDILIADSLKKISGTNNIIISTERSQKMIGIYRDTFERHPTLGSRITALMDSIWISKANVADFKNILQVCDTASGYRIYHTANPNDLDSGSPGVFKSKTNITFLPVMLKDKMTYVIRNFKNTSPVSNPHVVDYANVFPLIENFDTIYHRGLTQLSQKKVHSKAVYFDKVVFQVLDSLFKIDDKLPAPLKRNLNGISILSASYVGDENVNELPSGIENINTRQSTFIIVPTKLVKGKTINDWPLLDAMKIYIESKSLKFFGGYNHGELCPQICQ